MLPVVRLVNFCKFSCANVGISYAVIHSQRRIHVKAEDAVEVSVPLPYGHIAGEQTLNKKSYSFKYINSNINCL